MPPRSDSSGALFRAYVRSLRWQVPFTLVAVVVLWGLDVNGMRAYGFGPVLMVGIGLLVVLSPLLFLRYEFTWRQDRRLAIWLALSIVWMAVSGVLVFALLALVVGD
ncbi:hypothetical protein EUA06_07260 [Nocardioides glacieisoli]|uniref:Uncharacterized protein n=1 Tax=Nocardioides glacieisoli TaxID=1168730 RepID=A0A4V1RKL7_9ACTN|nr:hypothetical protein [Nocardioides glacieisoli]RYB92722.1 hypothetical protein EUA06_07260 [Nocardioides glacieisoli]